MSQPSRSVALTGTEEPVTPPRILRAGALSAELDNGNLRAIRYGWVEIIRAVSFLVRDRNWGTYNATIDDLKVEESAERFEVYYSARAVDAEQSFRYSARIVGTPQSLDFSAEGEAESAFRTNRTGFVVLHPLEGVAGRPVTIEHVDGSMEESRFPEIIDPLQPMMELRALTHEPVPGVEVSCRMEGDTFEMEDQRNWTDASYKTYVRPLAKPWPYTLSPGERLVQSVSLAVKGEATGKDGGDGRPVALEPRPGAGIPPRVGVGLQRSELAATRDVLDLLKSLAPHYVVYHHDPRTGEAADLSLAADICRALGAEPWLEAVIAEVDGFAEEVAALGRSVAAIGSPFKVVQISPAADLKSTLPGSQWPPAPPADELYRAARAAFPQARIAGGMFSFFTELNRKRPPLQDLDLVGFTTSAIVHAGDDRTVMQNLESLPFVAASARAIAGDRGFIVGPSAIGMRMNPYGDAPVRNPSDERQAMKENDPRQRGLLGAAFALGYFAHFARGGAEAIAFGGTTGPHGVVALEQAWRQPGFEETGGVFPVFHVQRALAQLSKRPMRDVTSSDPGGIQALAATLDDGEVLLVANLTDARKTIALPFDMARARILDAGSFAEAAASPSFLDDMRPASGRELVLDSYAVAKVSSG
ncbi:hypothetical protein VSX64_16645 [Aurantimonas sp. C2-6-R+9]|uniref:hypothetical protein n=1 Tax=unclassified Aurantimonas TaxID=2638230 RepID=UPI002E1782E2|nr:MULTISPECIES: hypothetical protein [unclassified Aurantimonas]MEC5292264.1 hypothetical protein [Aurantimonas sp. C2-3-R2]MEC5382479.1 hypothetical protein [Aurantimonas sp. C2-6-R+9]MEC5413349.1 hypothetical protein [Aurantimonas sp. C2-4-R8]